MKYRVSLLVEIDLGDGVAFEDPLVSLPLMAEDLSDCAEHAMDDIAANLANGDVASSERRWHVQLEVADWKLDGE